MKYNKYFGLYVSCDGLVFRKENDKLILCKEHIKPDGYLYVNTCRSSKYFHDKKRREIAIHRLVADTYCGGKYNENTNNMYVVDHIDRNKLNNKKENLRYVSNSENILNSSSHIASKFGQEFIKKYGFSKTGHERLYAASRYYYNKNKTLNGFTYNERKKAPV